MSSTFTFTSTATFTRTHAKKISYRVAADLKRMQRYYGKPSDKEIEDFETELIELITAGYLETITYGFKRNDNWISPTLCYTALSLVNPDNDDNPGQIPAHADVKGASFYSYLTPSSAWSHLSSSEQAIFEDSLPFKRGYATEPGVDGFLQPDLVYTAGGRGVQRKTLRSW